MKRKNPIGEIILALTEEKGLSMQNLGKLSGCSSGVLSQMLSDDSFYSRRLTTKFAIRISKVLGISPEALMILQVVLDIAKTKSEMQIELKHIKKFIPPEKKLTRSEFNQLINKKAVKNDSVKAS